MMLCDMRPVTCGTWRFGGKGPFSSWFNNWINDKAVCRTAPATPGLLMIGKIQLQKTYKAYCPPQAEEMWVLDNGQFRVVFTCFRAGSCQGRHLAATINTNSHSCNHTITRVKYMAEDNTDCWTSSSSRDCSASCFTWITVQGEGFLIGL